MKYHDLTNQTFGRLTVLTAVDKPPNIKSRDKYWLCECQCGNETAVAAKSLKNGHTQSCGCLQAERAAESAKKLHAKHGHNRPGKETKEYRAWRSMFDRCYNESQASYPFYGGRGITVCPEWHGSFEAFLNAVGSAPTNQHSLDRIDPDGNYEPTNVRWATPKQQSRNRRDRHYFTFQGKTMILSDWAKETGICLGTLWSRIFSYGWSIERALTTNPNEYHHK